ncbi:MAG TPA: protein kinase [Blastocatellia bacterium]
MKTERWQQVEKLYHAALEREASQRADFLNKACAGDEDLRRDVESLLAYQDRAENFIELPALEVAAKAITDDESSLLVGRAFSHYKIWSLLGAGGMGEVYLAEDTTLGRKIALKLLPKEFTEDLNRVRRFEQEARAASALNHPNILTIHEIGQIGDSHFIVTEFIEGHTLRRKIAEVAVKLEVALDIAVQVASALSAAHAVGIVHRDIKPDNIMLRPDGVVKVLDFGLAKLIEQRPRLTDAEASTSIDVKTETGLVMGTARYMSPEQARGMKVDARTDVFSLGIVLYEMVTGRPPFVGETTSDVLVSVLDKEPPPIALHLPDAPPELERIVMKALRKDRDERYQTIKDMLVDLRSLKRQLEFEAELERSKARESSGRRSSLNNAQETAASLPARTARYRSGWNRWIVKVALGVGAIAVLAALWFLLPRPGGQTKEAPTPLKNATFTQLTDQSGPEYFPSLSPDGKSLVYASRASGNWDIYLQRVGGRNPINLTKDSSADDTQPAFSPDGERIAFRSEREGGGIYVMGATGESVRRVSDTGYNPAWSPDGEKILFATESITQPLTRPTNSQLWIVTIDSGDKRLITEGDALEPHWSPHGYRIAYWTRPKVSGQGEDIWTIPADGGEAVRVTSGTAINWNPVWSPEGKSLYFSSNRGGSMNIWRVPIDEKSGAVLGQPEAVTTIGAATSAQHLSFSRDGRLAYVAQEQIRNIRKVAFDPSTGKTAGEPVAITRGSMQLWFPDPSPDGEWLTCYSTGNQRHIFIMRTDGSDLRDLTDDNNRYAWPRWSPDGKRIAFSSRRTGDYEIWAINRDGSGLRQLTQSHGGHYSPWSPDGTRIAYSIHNPKNDCVIFQPDKAWGEQTPEYLVPLGDPNLSFEAWSWSPDGKRLVGIRHLLRGIHSGIGIYDLGSKRYDWLTDFGDFPLWLKDGRRILFVNQGKVLLFDTATRKYQPVLSVTDEDVDIGSPGLSGDNRMIYFTFVAAEADIWLLNLNKE